MRLRVSQELYHEGRRIWQVVTKEQNVCFVVEGWVPLKIWQHYESACRVADLLNTHGFIDLEELREHAESHGWRARVKDRRPSERRSSPPTLKDVKARRRKQGEPRRIIDDLAKRKRANLPEERELLLRAGKGGDEQAKERLVLSHLPLVFSIAEDFQNWGLEWKDLVQEGIVGLVDAINKFDHRGYVRFSTYATYRIRGCMHDALREKARTIRIPRGLQKRQTVLNEIGHDFTARTGRQPSVDELVSESGFTREEIEEVMLRPRVTESLNGLVDLDGQVVELGELLPAEEADELAGIGEDYGPLHRALAKLPPREELVLRLYYGLMGDPLTLRAIGEILGVTESRISQIHAKALAQLLPRYCHEASIRRF